jgi:thiol-disulfide isomerase/thioredoxin
MRILYTFFIVICLCMTNCQAKDWQSHNSHGQVVTASHFKNHWVLINYWAAWCPSCREEITLLNAFYSQHVHDTNFIFTSVNADLPDEETLKKDIVELGIHFPVLIDDPASIWHLELPPFLPVTILINPQGKLIQQWVGELNAKRIKEIEAYMMTAHGKA